jgi:Ca2+-binding RTX toxin-like protein
MFKTVLVGASALALTFAIEATASAQTCTGSPGNVTITTTTTATTVKLTNGTIKANAVDCGAATSVTINGTSANDTITLNYVPPTIPVTTSLGAGKNVVVLYGTGGADNIVCTAGGVNRDGVGGQDLTFNVLPASLIIHGKPGNDTINCAAFGMKVSIYAEGGNDTVTGTAFNDSIEMSTGDDFVDGGNGNDRINGATGNDTLNGGGGNDTFVVSKNFDGFDIVNGGGGTDNISYGSRTLGITAGNDMSEDLISDDTETIKGSKGHDTLDFGNSVLAHNLFGGLGDDNVRGGNGIDKVYGEDGNDNVYGGGGADKLYGGAGSDNMVGNAGIDTYDAGDGDDILESNDGVAEVVKCGLGNDIYITGNDTFTACELSRNEVPLTNGSFESNYNNWNLFDSTAGTPGGENVWGIGPNNGFILPNDNIVDFQSGLTVPAPCLSGTGLTFNAGNGANTAYLLQFFQAEHRLYRDITVPATAREMMFDLGFRMFGEFDGVDQVLRFNLRNPGTDAITQTLFDWTVPYVVNPSGDFTDIPTLTYVADVTAIAGQTIRIDLQGIMNGFCLPLQVDHFRFLTAGSPVAAESMTPPADLAVVHPTGRTGGAQLAAPTLAAQEPTEEEEIDDLGRELDEETYGDDAAGGCSSSRGGGSLAFGLLLGLALIVRRRR